MKNEAEGTFSVPIPSLADKSPTASRKHTIFVPNVHQLKDGIMAFLDVFFLSPIWGDTPPPNNSPKKRGLPKKTGTPQKNGDSPPPPKNERSGGGGSSEPCAFEAAVLEGHAHHLCCSGRVPRRGHSILRRLVLARQVSQKKGARTKLHRVGSPRLAIGIY